MWPHGHCHCTLTRMSCIAKELQSDHVAIEHAAIYDGKMKAAVPFLHCVAHV